MTTLAIGIPGLQGIGVVELLLIAGVVLLLFGPKRLPQLGKSLGKTVKALRDGVEGKGDKEEVAAAEADDVKPEPTVAKTKEPEEVEK